jgi:hypothetical protein
VRSAVSPRTRAGELLSITSVAAVVFATSVTS